MHQTDFKQAFPQLFWDVDTLDAQQHKKFIIERVLEHGSSTAVTALFEKYSIADITEIIKSSRRISLKQGYFGKINYILRMN